GELVGQIAETRRGEAVGSGCIWYQPEQPRPENARRDVAPYILSMFTVPEHRGHGLASRIARALIEDAKRRGHWQVVLHASPEGRSVYARLGFERRWEMRYWIDPAARAAWKRQRPAQKATRARRGSPR
ncbi:MAG: GNAT family N-acetyltransferase, partial [Thermoplasmata archaeon]|nr:GNAT family N-acetyltransferase [Thermoplasmata archaeon]